MISTISAPAATIVYAIKLREMIYFYGFFFLSLLKFWKERFASYFGGKVKRSLVVIVRFQRTRLEEVKALTTL